MPFLVKNALNKRWPQDDLKVLTMCFAPNPQKHLLEHLIMQCPYSITTMSLTVRPLNGPMNASDIAKILMNPSKNILKIF